MDRKPKGSAILLDAIEHRRTLLLAGTPLDEVDRIWRAEAWPELDRLEREASDVTP
jgi:hypothetical protein